jgi:hypothetical protein
MKWTTFYGTDIEIPLLSHQHLSNITWYYSLVSNSPTPPEIMYEINKRFGGMILPYHPMISFTQEINTLADLGYITNLLDSDIVVDRKWVGKLIYS